MIYILYLYLKKNALKITHTSIVYNCKRQSVVPKRQTSNISLFQKPVLAASHFNLFDDEIWRRRHLAGWMQTQTCDDIEERDLVDNNLVQETQQITGSTSEVFNSESSGFHVRCS